MLMLSRAGSCVLSLVLVGAVAIACGSDDGKKTADKDRPGSAGDGGAAGESSGTSGSAGTSGSTGTSGSGGSSGDAGAPPLLGGAGSGGNEPTAGAGETAGAGGEGPVVPFHGLYIGEEGDDAAAGTEDAPFETLAKAASMAQPGDTIVFLDGTFTMSNQIVPIPSGVNVAAQNAGQASLVADGGIGIFELAGDTKLSGLKVTDAQRVLRFAGAANASGTVTIENTSFANCTVTCLELTGTTKAIVVGTEGAVLGNGGNAYALLSETSSIDVTGGTLQNFGAAGIFRASEESTVTLTDLEVKGGTGPLLTLANEAVGAVDGIHLLTNAQVAFTQAGASELSVKNSDIATAPGTSSCFVINDGRKLTIEGSKIHACNNGLKSLIPTELTLIDTEFYDHSFGGADLDANGTRTVVIDGCSFHDSTYVGMRIGGSGTVLKLKMRDTSVDITSLANWHSVILNGTAASEIDLGTLAQPGGNTFLQRSATLSTALALQFNGVSLILAVGNTWTPSFQGANAQGKYVVTSGKVLEDATAVASGRNYTKPYTSTKIRLAEIP